MNAETPLTDAQEFTSSMITNPEYGEKSRMDVDVVQSDFARALEIRASVAEGEGTMLYGILNRMASAVNDCLPARHNEINPDENPRGACCEMSNRDVRCLSDAFAEACEALTAIATRQALSQKDKP